MIGCILFKLKKKKALGKQPPGLLLPIRLISNSCLAVSVTSRCWQGAARAAGARHVYRPTFYFYVYWVI